MSIEKLINTNIESDRKAKIGNRRLPVEISQIGQRRIPVSEGLIVNQTRESNTILPLEILQKQKPSDLVNFNLLEVQKPKFDKQKTPLVIPLESTQFLADLGGVDRFYFEDPRRQFLQDPLTSQLDLSYELMSTSLSRNTLRRPLSDIDEMSSQEISEKRKELNIKKYIPLKQLVAFISTAKSTKDEKLKSKYKEFCDYMAFNNEMFQKMVIDFDVKPVDLEHYIHSQSEQKYRSTVELISNAIDATYKKHKKENLAATFKKPQVRVVLRDDGYTVADMGIGMDSKTILEKLLIPNVSGSGEGTIGRFGVGFYTSLSHLESPDDEVLVRTNDGQNAYQISFKINPLYEDIGVSIEPINLEQARLEGQKVPCGTSMIVRCKDFEKNKARELIDYSLSYNDKHCNIVHQDGSNRFFYLVNNLKDFKKISGSETNIFYSTKENLKGESKVSVLVNGVTIESMSVEGIGMPKDVVLDFPLACSLPENRAELSIDKVAVNSVREMINSIFASEMSVQEKVSLCNALYPLLLKMQDKNHSQKNKDNIVTFFQAAFDQFADQIDLKSKLLVPNAAKYLNLGQKDLLYINPSLVGGSVELGNLLSSAKKVTNFQSSFGYELYLLEFNEHADDILVEQGKVLLYDRKSFENDDLHIATNLYLSDLSKGLHHSESKKGFVSRGDSSVINKENSSLPWQEKNISQSKKKIKAWMKERKQEENQIKKKEIKFFKLLKSFHLRFIDEVEKKLPFIREIIEICESQYTEGDILEAQAEMEFISRLFEEAKARPERFKFLYESLFKAGQQDSFLSKKELLKLLVADYYKSLSEIKDLEARLERKNNMEKVHANSKPKAKAGKWKSIGKDINAAQQRFAERLRSLQAPTTKLPNIKQELEQLASLGQVSEEGEELKINIDQSPSDVSAKDVIRQIVENDKQQNGKVDMSGISYNSSKIRKKRFGNSDEVEMSPLPDPYFRGLGQQLRESLVSYERPSASNSNLSPMIKAPSAEEKLEKYRRKVKWVDNFTQSQLMNFASFSNEMSSIGAFNKLSKFIYAKDRKDFEGARLKLLELDYSRLAKIPDQNKEILEQCLDSNSHFLYNTDKSNEVINFFYSLPKVMGYSAENLKLALNLMVEFNKATCTDDKLERFNNFIGTENFEYFCEEFKDVSFDRSMDCLFLILGRLSPNNDFSDKDSVMKRLIKVYSKKISNMPAEQYNEIFDLLRRILNIHLEKGKDAVGLKNFCNRHPRVRPYFMYIIEGGELLDINKNPNNNIKLDAYNVNFRLSELYQTQRLRESEVDRFQGSEYDLHNFVNQEVVSQNYDLEEVERDIAHAINNQIVNDDYLWVREMIQNSVDELIRAGIIGGKVSLETYLEEEGQDVVISINDPIGMDLNKIVNYLLIPHKSDKKDIDELIGKFGQGFFTIFKGSKEVRIKTSTGNGVVNYLSVKPIKDQDIGKIYDLDIQVKQALGENFKGSKIQKVVDSEIPELDAAFCKNSMIRNTGLVDAKKVKIFYNKSQVNEEREILSQKNIPELEGNVTIYEAGENALTQNGLYIKDLCRKYFALTPRAILAAINGGGIVIDLPAQVKLIKSRNNLAKEEDVLKILGTYIPAMMLEIFLGKLQKGTISIKEIANLPYDFFDIDHAGKYIIASRDILQDAHKISRGDNLEDYSRYINDSESLMLLLANIKFIEIDDKKFSINEIVMRVAQEKEKFDFSVLPKEISQHLKTQLWAMQEFKKKTLLRLKNLGISVKQESSIVTANEKIGIVDKRIIDDFSLDTLSEESMTRLSNEAPIYLAFDKLRQNILEIIDHVKTKRSYYYHMDNSVAHAGRWTNNIGRNIMNIQSSIAALRNASESNLDSDLISFFHSFVRIVTHEKVHNLENSDSATHNEKFYKHQRKLLRTLMRQKINYRKMLEEVKKDFPNIENYKPLLGTDAEALRFFNLIGIDLKAQIKEKNPHLS